MFFKRLFKPIRLFIELLGIFYDFLQTFSYVGGSVMTTASLITYSQNIPTIIPVTLLVLGMVFFGVGIFRTVYRYKMWNSLKDIPELEAVLRKALDIHIYISGLRKTVIKENTHKNIKTKTRMKLANKYFETLKIPLESLPKYTNPDGSIKDKLYKKMGRQLHLKEGNFFTVLPFLKDYGRLLNKSKLGLKSVVQDNPEYDRIKNEFLGLQLKLNVPDKYINEINRLPELSYGLNSISIGINLINETRSWYKTIPDSYIEQKDDSENIVDTAYLRASMWVKNNVRQAMFREGLK